MVTVKTVQFSVAYDDTGEVLPSVADDYETAEKLAERVGAIWNRKMHVVKREVTYSKWEAIDVSVRN